jgi:O-succinylbenzoic acid--CoA ligase
VKELRVVPPGPAVLEALRDALAGGPALLVSAASATSTDGLPATVPQRIALVVETSGSTGRPKRVALSADAVLANAAASESSLGGPGQWVLALPTHNIAGLNVLARSIAAETQPVAVTSDHFTAAAFVEATRRLSVPEHFTSLVPAQLGTLLDDETGEAVAALRTFQAVLVGGQSTPPPLLARAADHGIRVIRSYGSSETSGGCVYDGAPIGTTGVRIVDGEVWLSGPSLAEGYLDDDALTDARFVTADGIRWFRTADAGDWDGTTLAVTGRLDDVIVSGGVKISLGRLEHLLREQDGFADAVVVKAPSERWGETSVVFTTAEIAPEDVTAAFAVVVAVLGVAGRPDRVIRLDALPMLASGKVDRVALGARAAG